MFVYLIQNLNNIVFIYATGSFTKLIKTLVGIVNNNWASLYNS